MVNQMVNHLAEEFRRANIFFLQVAGRRGTDASSDHIRIYIMTSARFISM